LEAVAQEMRETYGVEAEVIALDLGDSVTPQELYNRAKEQGREVEILINNAGFGVYGLFADTPWERTAAMLQLDIVSLTHLTKLFLEDMLKRNSGYVLHVASVAAYQATPSYAAYAAAKSYVLHFSEALHHELRDTNVIVSALSPGFTETEFFEVSGQKSTFFRRMSAMDSPTVARIGIKAMLSGKASKISGFMNAFSAFGVRFIPRSWQRSLAGLLMKTS
ncbi:MAG: SDR family NAD(P)-dependent oxidoreductase, partial [Calditrichota bacterium]